MTHDLLLTATETGLAAACTCGGWTRFLTTRPEGLTDRLLKNCGRAHLDHRLLVTCVSEQKGD
jgi:hypothetical protein